MTQTRTLADTTAERLNAYTLEHDDPTDVENPYNPYQDIIFDVVDETWADETEVTDDTEFRLTDGSWLVCDRSRFGGPWFAKAR